MNHCGGKNEKFSFLRFYTESERDTRREREGGRREGGKERVKKNLDNLLGMENLGNMQEK